MNVGKKLIAFSVDHPWFITGTTFLACLILILTAALPTLWPAAFPMLQPVRVDTDPENMLNKDEPAKSGAHLVAGGVPRFVSVGDTQMISENMPYRLKEVIETKPDEEYKLYFEDKNGKPSQATYRKQ